MRREGNQTKNKSEAFSVIFPADRFVFHGGSYWQHPCAGTFPSILFAFPLRFCFVAVKVYVLRAAPTRGLGNLVARRSAACTVFASSMVMVIGPTPPGTGVM